jgi:hypothetical protein
MMNYTERYTADDLQLYVDKLYSMNEEQKNHVSKKIFHMLRIMIDNISRGYYPNERIMHQCKSIALDIFLKNVERLIDEDLKRRGSDFNNHQRFIPGIIGWGGEDGTVE